VCLSGANKRQLFINIPDPVDDLLTNVICMFDSAKYDSENKTNKKMHVQ
jgi:hypothetical protein